MSEVGAPAHGSRPPRPSRFTLAALAALAAGAFLAGAWGQELWSSREGRVAACAQAMIDTGDWLEPNLGAEFRAKKPPLAYWLAALSGLTVGRGRVTDFAAKLPSVLAALGTVLAVFALGRRALGSRRAGFLAALALAGTWLFWEESHTAAADMPMTCFVTLAVLGFWRLLEDVPRTRLDRALPWLALALAFMTKGPVAVAVPLLAVFGYLTAARRWRDWRRLLPGAVGLAATLAAALSWYAAVLLRRPDALGVWLGESFGRMLPGSEARSNPNPLAYLLDDFWAAALPWCLLLPALAAALWSRRRSGAPLPAGVVLGLCWTGLGLALFSISFSKRGYYLLPLLPGLALCVGWLLDELVEARLPRAAELLCRVPLGLVGALLALGPLAAALAPRLVAAAGQEWPAALELGRVPLACLAAAGAALAAMSLAPACRRWPLAEGALSAVVAALAWAGLAVLPGLNARKSPARFCAEVARRTPPGRPLAEVGTERFPLLVHYLGRGRVVDLKWGEFLSDEAFRHGETVWGIAEAGELAWAVRTGRLTARMVFASPGRSERRLVLFEPLPPEPGKP